MMKKTHVIYIGILFGSLFLLTNYSGGPANGTGGNYSGATGSTCSSMNGGCHSGGTVNGSLTVTSNVVGHYVPGQTYTITVSLSDPELVQGGFNLTAVKTGNVPVGTFTATAETQTFDSGSSIEHGTPQAQSGSNVTWTLDWTAPSIPSTNITFYCAALAGNGGGSSGDAVYTHVTSAVALPIQLISFDAKKINETNILRWKTGDQTNFSHFTVEKSNDGKSFLPIQRIDYNRATNDYQYSDKENTDKKTYYRLKMIDFDGRFDYSSILVVNDDKNKKLDFYPNPANDILRINGENDLEKVIVFNELGEMIILNVQQKNIDVSNLPEGIYFLQVDETTTKRFVIAR